MVERLDAPEADDPKTDDDVTLTVENIGGINRCDITVNSGVTVLEGRNATNRTSLLTAVADVLGGSPATVKSDADRAWIELDLGGDRLYSREYVRQNGGLSAEGNHYTDERESIDLFVRLLEDNPVRRAVENDGDLRDLIMKPVDTERIRRDIRDLERERTQIDDRLDEVERERTRLPSLEKRRSELETELETLTDEIEAVRSTVDEYEADKAEAERAEDILEELTDRRQRLQDVTSRIDRQNEKITELQAERDELDAEFEEITVPDSELTTLESKLEELRREKRSLDNAIDDLQRIVRFNNDLVDGAEIELPGIDTESDVTADLDPTTKSVECWTCGSRVERNAIANRLEELRGVVRERREEREELEREIETLEDRATELRQTADRKATLEDRIESTEEEIEIRTSKRDELLAESDQLRNEIDGIEAQIDETEELRESDLVESYQRLSELEYERGQVEHELGDVTEQIDRVESLTEESERLTARREEIDEEITELRSRIETLEERAIAQFNEHMATVLGILDYENLTRVWIERKADRSNHDRDVAFDLHVVRETADGAVYEDTVDTLSESEREVIGLVVALAGYLAHDVRETVPFMLLDSLEAIDADRLAELVDYFAEHVPYLIVALLPEDAAAVADGYDRVAATALIE
jgi:DNA repair exonuclease SbcCD ATPase subunit